MHAGLGAFLDAVDDEVLRLGVGERLRAMRLYLSRAPDAWSDDELRASLCALLSQDEFQYRHMGVLYGQHVSGSRALEATREAVQEEPGPARQGKVLPGGELRLPLRLRIVPWLRIIGVGGPLCALLWFAAGMVRPPDEPQAKREAAVGGPKEELRVMKERVWRIEQVAERWQAEVRVGAPALGWWDWAKVMGVSMVCFLLGLRFVLLPRGQRRSGLAQREAMRRAQIEKGLPRRPTYDAPAFSLVPAHLAEDTATLLGRVFREERGQDLDLDRTVRETVRACGRVVPVFAGRRARREILFLIDEERGGYPMLEPFWRLARTWRRLGVGIVCLRYRYRPTQSLFSEDGQRALELGEVLRQHEGAALVLFSRLRQPLGLHFEDRWIDEVAELPLRAWLDPDPRTEEEREPEERRVAHRMAQAGFGRFPFSPRGVLALARYLAAEGIGVGPPPEEALLPMEEVRAAIERWARAAAMVPDASWDQVEEFRRALPGLAEALPDARYVGRLVEWLAEETGKVPEGGDVLDIPSAEQDRLIRAGRREEPGLPAEGWEGEVRRMLLEQLEGEEPQDPLLQWYVRLAKAKHQAILEPERAAAIFAAFVGSPVEEEAMIFLRAEVARQGERRVLPQKVEVDLRLQCKEGVPAGALLRGEGRVWRWAALGTMGVMAGVVLLVLGAGRLPLRKIRGEWPRIVAAKEAERRRLAETERRAEMVEIFPGRFIMGSLASEEGRLDDEKEHEVELTQGFFMGVTEVTQGQYVNVMGVNPSEFQKLGGDHPVEKVSWFDAVQYCNRLSAAESLISCYEVEKKRGQEDPEVRLVKGCTGYRLPTEAEWEYAARAGERTIYAGSNRLEDVADTKSPTTHPVKTKKHNAWGLYDMSGNVWEWAWDWFGKYPDDPLTRDPSGPERGTIRVFRGGSFGDGPLYLRVALRVRNLPGLCAGSLGFRLVRSLP